MIGLVEFIDEHRDAVEFDLIALGLRLRDFPNPGFTWRDLMVIVRQSPTTSAVYRAVAGEDWQWGLPEQLLAAAVDALNGANWQRGHGKEQDRPKPIPRPGVKPEDNRWGKGALPVDEMADWLGWERELTGG